MGERVRWRLAANVGVVLGLFASVLALAAIAAPEARADGVSCTKSANGGGVLLTVEGFDAADSAAIRRNDKWAGNVDVLGDPISVDGLVDDDWKLRLRGELRPDPYLEITCSAVPVDGAASCTIVDDGALRADFAGFVADDSLNLRRGDKWVATVDGQITSVDDLPGSRADAWTLRVRGAEFDTPYSTIECETGDVVEPPPPVDVGCRVTAAGLEWDDAGADAYQVRRNGKWLASTVELSFATNELQADWVIRYRGEGGRIEVACEEGPGRPRPVDPNGPCVIFDREIESMLNAGQCWFAEGVYAAQGVEPDGVFDPCEAGWLECEDVVTGMRLEGVAPPLGLEYFPDLWWLVIVDAEFVFPEAISQLSSLEFLDLSGSTTEIPGSIGQLPILYEFRFNGAEISSLPPEIGQLDELAILSAEGSTLTALPDEIGDAERLEYLSISSTEVAALPESLGNLELLFELRARDLPNLESIPVELWNNRQLRVLDFTNSGITSIPVPKTPRPFAPDMHFGGTPLVGDQADWLQGLGNPMLLAPSIVFPTDDCRIWVSDPAWNAYLLEAVDGWENCDAPEEPPADFSCRVIAGGIEWDEQAVDDGLFHIRRDGSWFTTTSDDWFPADVDGATWAVRYRVDGERMEVPCVEDVAGPCVLLGQVVTSIMNGRQCEAATALAEAHGRVVGLGVAGDPCEWTGELTFTCTDGLVVGLDSFGPQVAVLPSGLRHFPDLRFASFFGTAEFPIELTAARGLQTLDFEILDSLPPEIGRLTNLERLEIFGASIQSLPPEIGQLESLRALELSSTELQAIPVEIGNLQALESLVVVESSIESIPVEVFALPNLRELVFDDSPLAELPIPPEPPLQLELLSVAGTNVSGDQSAFLTALGEPGSVNVTLYLFGDCNVWVTDPGWSAWLNEDILWMDNCQPPA